MVWVLQGGGGGDPTPLRGPSPCSVAPKLPPGLFSRVGGKVCILFLWRSVPLLDSGYRRYPESSTGPPQERSLGFFFSPEGVILTPQGLLLFFFPEGGVIFTPLRVLLILLLPWGVYSLRAGRFIYIYFSPEGGYFHPLRGSSYFSSPLRGYFYPSRGLLIFIPLRGLFSPFRGYLFILFSP
jgi:hypothetical protein